VPACPVSAMQRFGALDQRLRARFARGDGNLPLSKPVRSATPGRKTAGHWRMSANMTFRYPEMLPKLLLVQKLSSIIITKAPYDVGAYRRSSGTGESTSVKRSRAPAAPLPSGLAAKD
jgi:hypothetical protein